MMKVMLKKMFEFYINCSFHVALSVVCFTLVTRYHFKLEVVASELVLIFCSAVAGYNFVKFSGLTRSRSDTDSLRAIRLISYLAAAVSVFLLLTLPIKSLLLFLILAVLTMLYALPLVCRRNLRSVAGLKIFLIAAVWAGVSVAKPLLEEGILWTTDGLVEFGQRFLFVLVLILPFEIRDLKFDPENLKTLPQRLGVSATKWFGSILLLAVLGLELLHTERTDPLLIVMLVLLGFLLLKSKVEQPKFFSSFWIEGLPILWFLILWLSEF